MKTVLEQLIEVNEKLSLIEKAVFGDNSEEFTPCCSSECDCGCVEPETETNEDDEPNLDTVIDTPERNEPKYTFTESDLITFATKLTERALNSVKESLENVDISNDDHVSLELDWNNTIQIELDEERIKKDIMDEVEGNISLCESDVVDEIESIMNEIRHEDPNDDGEGSRF
jgi:hypothetical protein